jgi:formylglycine-generating enzyme required for sulfatase activity
MGSELSAETQPIHDVELSSFALTRAEITKRQYLACVDAGACDAPTCNVAPSDQPMGCVTWGEAYQFASWIGGRLPSEAEWAWAARGATGRLYPWGSAEPSCEYAYMNGCGAPSRVCALSAGHTPEGVCDLAGSVSEWVMDEWHDNYLGAPTDGGPWCDRGCSPDDPTFKVIRGGSWQEGAEGQRASHRSFVSPALRLDSLGFRVARDLSAPKAMRD